MVLQAIEYHSIRAGAVILEGKVIVDCLSGRLDTFHKQWKEMSPRVSANNQLSVEQEKVVVCVGFIRAEYKGSVDGTSNKAIQHTGRVSRAWWEIQMKVQCLCKEISMKSVITDRSLKI